MGPWNFDGNDLCLLATDVEALFPSLDSREASRIVKEVVSALKIVFEGGTPIHLPEQEQARG